MENKDIKVSVIIPVYNVDSYLSICIDSVMHQTHTNIEIILVNDGSTDTSGNICDDYALKDNRIVVKHCINSGVSSARNIGIETSTGEYICFVDADDYVMDDYVAYLLSLAVNNKAEIALTTKMFGNFDSKQIHDEEVQIWNAEEATEAILCYQVPIGVYCKLFESKFIKKDIRFLTELFIGEGFNFNIMAFQKSINVAVGKKKIYYYRRDNPTSATTKFSEEKWINGLYAIQLIKHNLSLSSKKIDRAWNYANWRTNSDVFDVIMLAHASKKYPNLYKKSKSITRRKAYTAFLVPTSNNNKLRAFVMLVYPRLIPIAMQWRRKKFKAEV
ncbi:MULTISPECIES: glycosyltransferase family 2 protein [Lactococcus]|uniref:glycosyltransferase family 2 protein n=1 Tax=Lactococcus TaxID=1357 RepID=UPI00038A69A5|nr:MULTISPECIES: glycosyltransferase family 2 protein [Lactococcus]EQC89192.1 hypothetical protein LLDT4_00890 [Lactococcus lactis subsp. lactis bv. diacetylactis str. TIFN4]MCT4431368.1 glycosyltransferase family 2 protein [Lactococcus cremoris]